MHDVPVCERLTNAPFPVSFIFQSGAFSRGTPPIADTKWHHIAFSFRGSDKTLSVAMDGQVATFAFSTPPVFDSTLSTWFGFSQQDAGQLVTGLRVVQGAATLPYFSAYTVPTTPVGLFNSGTTVLLVRCLAVPSPPPPPLPPISPPPPPSPAAPSAASRAGYP